MSKRVELVAEVTGSIWKIESAVGGTVESGQPVIIVESMKMEIPIEAPCAGKVVEIRCKESEPVSEGDVVAIIEAA